MPMLTVLLLLALAAAPAQRIETQFPDHTKIIRVETVMNHLTVIELAEPVTLAAVGSPLFNFDGTFRGGLGDPQQAQIGAHWVF